MKRILLSALVAASAATVAAQVNFYVMPVSPTEEINEKAAQTVYRKAEQILTRNSAAAAGEADVFGVRAELALTGENKSSGLVREVASISGELTLTALNRVDNAKYYSVTVPLNAVVKGNTPAIEALANSIKTTDAVFTRFVRVAREKVEAYYEDHCQEVLNRAQMMAVAGDELAAMVYLTGLSPSAPCYEEGLQIVASLRERLEAESPKEDSMPGDKETDSSTPADPAPVVSEPSSKPVPAVPADQFADAKITLSDKDWKFELKSAQYQPSSKRISIVAMLTYIGSKKMDYDVGIYFRRAINPDGDAYDSRFVTGNTYRRFPEDIPVKVEFIAENVKVNPERLAFVGLQVNNTQIEIRNLLIINE